MIRFCVYNFSLKLHLSFLRDLVQMSCSPRIESSPSHLGLLKLLHVCKYDKALGAPSQVLGKDYHDGNAVFLAE